MKRTGQRKGMRPMLNTLDPLVTTIELDKIRAPLYESIANFTYKTDIYSPSMIADMIFEKIFLDSR